MAGEELKKIPNEKQRELLLFIQYSNISGIYTELNQMDSAKVYAELSQLKYKVAYKRNDVVAQNFWTLGKVAEHEKNYPKALSYFKKAEKLEGYKNHANLELIYNDIINSYENLQHEDSVRIYQIKRDSLKLAIAENQKKSLTTLLNEKKENNNQWLYYTLGVLLVFILILIFSIRRKNKILAEQEKISQQYLAKISENPTGEYYSKLLKALKEKDPAFMFYFEETFPDFSSKLIQINPKISVADIEFCALLKIKIPTKDIAKYKYFEMQTVRNKKYLIRKKLNIPKESDIYQWLDEL
ncbi:MAG TPA: hypothetical protein VLZ72_06945 [Flavobacterium sp.]|nr:hypothetical protein [Flavobacterium sp.]